MSDATRRKQKRKQKGRPSLPPLKLGNPNKIPWYGKDEPLNAAPSSDSLDAIVPGGSSPEI